MTKTCASSSATSSPAAGSKNKIFSENKVTRSRDSSPSDLIVAEEMQELLCKLKDLVPGVPRHKKLSKLEIIQYVIDYIFELQQALDNPPSGSPPHHVTSSSPFASFRQPLSTLSYPSV